MKVAQWWLGALVWAMFHSSATGTPELSSLTVAGAGATADWLPEFAAQTETYGIGLNENSTVPHVQISWSGNLAGVTISVNDVQLANGSLSHQQELSAVPGETTSITLILREGGTNIPKPTQGGNDIRAFGDTPSGGCSDSDTRCLRAGLCRRYVLYVSRGSKSTWATGSAPPPPPLQYAYCDSFGKCQAVPTLVPPPPPQEVLAPAQLNPHNGYYNDGYAVGDYG